MCEQFFKESIRKGLANIDKIKKEKETIYKILNQAKSDIKDFYCIELTIKECIYESTISILKNDFSIIDIDIENKYIYSHIEQEKSQKYKNKKTIIEVLNETFESFDFVKMMKEVDL